MSTEDEEILFGGKYKYYVSTDVEIILILKKLAVNENLRKKTQNQQKHKY